MATTPRSVSLSKEERVRALTDAAGAPWLADDVATWVDERDLDRLGRQCGWLELTPHPDWPWHVNAADLLVDRWQMLLARDAAAAVPAAFVAPPAASRAQAPSHSPACRHSHRQGDLVATNLRDLDAALGTLPACGSCHGYGLDLRDLHAPLLRETALVGLLTWDDRHYARFHAGDPGWGALSVSSLRTCVNLTGRLLEQSAAVPASVPLQVAADSTLQVVLARLLDSARIGAGLDKVAFEGVSDDDLDVLFALAHPGQDEQDSASIGSPFLLRQAREQLLAGR